MPAYTDTSFSLWIFVVLSVFLVIRYRKKFIFFELFFYFGLLIAAISSIRHIPLWIIIALPLTVQGLWFLYKEAEGIRYGSQRFLKAFTTFFIFVIILAVPDLLMVSYFVKPQEDHLRSAVSYLRHNTPRRQVFSPYNWGGYLIRNLPSKKVFIDGRMASWQWNAHIAGESDYVFDEYIRLLKNEALFETTVSRYKISTLFLPRAGDVEKTVASDWEEKQMEAIYTFFNLPFVKREELAFAKVITGAKRAGWVVVYQDKYVIIYQDVRSEKKF